MANAEKNCIRTICIVNSAEPKEEKGILLGTIQLIVHITLSMKCFFKSCMDHPLRYTDMSAKIAEQSGTELVHLMVVHDTARFVEVN